MGLTPLWTKALGAASISALLGAVVACAPADHDVEDVREALTAFSRDVDNKDLAATCGLFADDVVLSFPGRPPQGHTEVCERFRRLFADPARSYRYAAPSIREILVDGDLATVALVWTLTVTDRQGRVLETTREDGLDVLRRQADGTWRIHISHAFPIEDG